MDKKFVMGIAAMAALTLVSCSSDDLDSFSDNSSKNEAISFDGYLGRSAVAVNGTRGSVETAETLKKEGFGVFGNYKADAGQTSDPDFFKNQEVTYSTTESKWTYTPLKFWPANGEINFLAYAPYNYDGTNTTLTGTSISFNVDKTAANQKDLLWTNAKGQITADFASTKAQVKFQFHHALSRLGYTVKLSGNYPSGKVTFTLKKITLAGSPDGTTKKAFYSKGTIDLSKTATNDNKEELSKTNSETGLWKADDAKQNFEWFDAGDQSVKITYVDPNKKPAENPVSNKDYLFVIPQNFPEKIVDASGQKIDNPDKLYVIVEYTIHYEDNGKEQTNKVYKQITPNFLQGKAYMLNLTIGRPIEFDVDLTNGVDNWGTEDNINIGSDGNLWDGIE